MNPENDTLRVTRVANGWVIGTCSYRREGMDFDSQFVATSPEQLAGLLLAWAQQQEKTK